MGGAALGDGGDESPVVAIAMGGGGGGGGRGMDDLFAPAVGLSSSAEGGRSPGGAGSPLRMVGGRLVDPAAEEAARRVKAQADSATALEEQISDKRRRKAEEAAREAAREAAEEARLARERAEIQRRFQEEEEKEKAKATAEVNAANEAAMMAKKRAKELEEAREKEAERRAEAKLKRDQEEIAAAFDRDRRRETGEPASPILAPHASAFPPLPPAPPAALDSTADGVGAIGDGTRASLFAPPSPSPSPSPSPASAAAAGDGETRARLAAYESQLAALQAQLAALHNQGLDSAFMRGVEAAGSRGWQQAAPSQAAAAPAPASSAVAANAAAIVVGGRSYYAVPLGAEAAKPAPDRPPSKPAGPSFHTRSGRLAADEAPLPSARPPSGLRASPINTAAAAYAGVDDAVDGESPLADAMTTSIAGESRFIVAGGVGTFTHSMRDLNTTFARLAAAVPLDDDPPGHPPAVPPSTSTVGAPPVRFTAVPDTARSSDAGVDAGKPPRRPSARVGVSAPVATPSPEDSSARPPSSASLSGESGRKLAGTATDDVISAIDGLLLERGGTPGTPAGRSRGRGVPTASASPVQPPPGMRRPDGFDMRTSAASASGVMDASFAPDDFMRLSKVIPAAFEPPPTMDDTAITGVSGSGSGSGGWSKVDGTFNTSDRRGSDTAYAAAYQHSMARLRELAAGGVDRPSSGLSTLSATPSEYHPSTAVRRAMDAATNRLTDASGGDGRHSPPRRGILRNGRGGGGATIPEVRESEDSGSGSGSERAGDWRPRRAPAGGGGGRGPRQRRSGGYDDEGGEELDDPGDESPRGDRSGGRPRRDRDAPRNGRATDRHRRGGRDGRESDGDGSADSWDRRGGGRDRAGGGKRGGRDRDGGDEGEVRRLRRSPPPPDRDRRSREEGLVDRSERRDKAGKAEDPPPARGHAGGTGGKHTGGVLDPTVWPAHMGTSGGGPVVLQRGTPDAVSRRLGKHAGQLPADTAWM